MGLRLLFQSPGAWSLQQRDILCQMDWKTNIHPHLSPKLIPKMIRHFCQQHSKKMAFSTVEDVLWRAVQEHFSYAGMLHSALQMLCLSRLKFLFLSQSNFIQLFFFPVLFFSYFKLNESLLKTKAKQSSFCQAGLTSIVKWNEWSTWEREECRHQGNRLEKVPSCPVTKGHGGPG